jgi:serine phosphatase RsbU (regulator of sigma subunit)
MRTADLLAIFSDGVTEAMRARAEQFSGLREPAAGAQRIT